MTKNGQVHRAMALAAFLLGSALAACAARSQGAKGDAGDGSPDGSSAASSGGRGSSSGGGDALSGGNPCACQPVAGCNTYCCGLCPWETCAVITVPYLPETDAGADVGPANDGSPTPSKSCGACPPGGGGSSGAGPGQPAGCGLDADDAGAPVLRCGYISQGLTPC